MKLLLTSNGLTNSSIENALEDLAVKPRKDIKIAFIPTSGFPADATNIESTDWFVNDVYPIKEFCGFIDIVSLADLPSNEIMKRLEYVDVIFVGGGNSFYLSYCMEKAGLFEELPRLLETRVYAGISAGSIIATDSIRTASQAIINPDKFHDELYDLLGPKGKSAGKTAKLVNIVVRPHYLSKSFPEVKGDYLEEIAEDVNVPLYAIDDHSAIKIDGDKIEVISEGKWRIYE